MPDSATMWLAEISRGAFREELAKFLGLSDESLKRVLDWAKDEEAEGLPDLPEGFSIVMDILPIVRIIWQAAESGMPPDAIVQALSTTDDETVNEAVRRRATILGLLLRETDEERLKKLCQRAAKSVLPTYRGIEAVWDLRPVAVDDQVLALLPVVLMKVTTMADGETEDMRFQLTEEQLEEFDRRLDELKLGHVRIKDIAARFSGSGPNA
ncbi:MAG: hypothetical protein JXA57_08915 [Armatimonadetes bacterium]|nr:hypothetical protein [Armatimonadota bacterium]